jgi:hydrogenase maturation protein HypF
MMEGVRISIRGAVQGVGFRPFIYKLAKTLNIKGYVLNTPQGVIIEAQAEESLLKEFIERIQKEKPPISLIQKFIIENISISEKFNNFEIKKSDLSGSPNAIVLPDIATCKDCYNEIFDSKNRRYLYPFTNCTNCGPRFSIIESLPYDRGRTTMKNFVMCDECKKEYENPEDRRFHAQPNACPKCGPQIELWNPNGEIITKYNDAILQTVQEIRNGKIIAIKGLGGFHLVVDAMNDDAIKRLRNNKNREEKPFALMYPDVNSVKYDCEVSEQEENLLFSAQSPIVLLKRKKNCKISVEAAPLNPNLGIMLPYTPLHHILMFYLKSPIIATSGNYSEEPICIDESEALTRLKGIADLFLVHNRPIYRYVDDSIARIVLNDKFILRRARGYAPMPVIINNENKEQLLSVGGHLKNTIAVSKGNEVFLSQHIGDLETVESNKSFTNTIDKFREIYRIEPEKVICDLHPDYISTKYAREKYKNVIPVQHHLSHILSVIAENEINGSLLGISWDGTGYGTDGTIWGGEFFIINNDGYKRAAHLKSFHLPGGESSLKDIHKISFGLLYEIFGKDINKYLAEDLKQDNDEILLKMLIKNINSPVCSSAGRLFDAVASILDIRQKVNFEGQAAMELEFLTDGIISELSYNFEIYKDENEIYVIDWTKMIIQLLDDKLNRIKSNLISVKFHNTLVNMIVEIAKLFNEKIIALSGGCFQNKYLLENSVKKLQELGFKVYWNKEVPANDGGISLGQIAYYSYFKKTNS